MSHAAFGLTLREYADACGRSPAAVREAYRAVLRGYGCAEPLVTRRETHSGLIKFCLALDAPGSLETESVLIPMRSYRGASWYTLCLSSQVGCRMGCTFCETGRMGLQADLTAAQIVRQYTVAARLLAGAPNGAILGAPAVRNVVFMGMGEPFDNLEAVVQAIRVFTDPGGIGLPPSRITVSTVGRVDGIRRLAARARDPGRDRAWEQVRLAVSLGAPQDHLRAALVPIGRRMPLAALRAALRDYPLPPRGRFLIEYVLLAGVNDAPADADAVAAWCDGLPCIVNVIPYNPQRGAAYATPAEPVVRRFLDRLRARGVFAKRRLTQGRDLMGACGQLGNPTVPCTPSPGTMVGAARLSP